MNFAQQKVFTTEECDTVKVTVHWLVNMTGEDAKSITQRIFGQTSIKTICVPEKSNTTAGDKENDLTLPIWSRRSDRISESDADGSANSDSNAEEMIHRSTTGSSKAEATDPTIANFDLNKLKLPPAHKNKGWISKIKVHGFLSALREKKVFTRALDKRNPAYTFNKEQYFQAWTLAVEKTADFVIERELCNATALRKEVNQVVMEVRINRVI
jgi:hypothetical protein